MITAILSNKYIDKYNLFQFQVQLNLQTAYQRPAISFKDIAGLDFV